MHIIRSVSDPAIDCSRYVDVQSTAPPNQRQPTTLGTKELADSSDSNF